MHSVDSMNEMFQRLVVSGLIQTSDLVEGGHCAAASSIMMTCSNLERRVASNEERPKRDRSDCDVDVVADRCTTLPTCNQKATFDSSDIDVVRKIAEAILEEGIAVEDRDIDDLVD